ncbi:MAG: 50S ribosomal protein L10 [Planctomycetes bacterium RBG_16_59_8]|nr:MAG: 50S ribosomal protein L10 [Planctomycetes bacterium RBG_16_59_8]
MTKLLRKRIADEFVEEFRNTNAVLLVDYSRMTAGQAVEMRTQLREAGMSAAVIKNTTAAHVFDKLGWTGLSKHLGGMTLLAYGNDPAILAKKVVAFKKKHNVADVRYGYIDGRLLNQQDVKTLSELPSREQLLGMVVGTIAMPLNSFVWTLNGVISQLLRGVQAVADKKEKEGASQAPAQ